MKILMVLESEFPPDDRVEKEAVSLIKDGHEVILACYTMEKRQGLEIYKGIKIYRRPISKFVYKSSVGILRFPVYFNFWRKYLKEIYEIEKFEAVHIHDLPLVKVGLELKDMYSIPVVYDMHENYPVLLELSTHTKKPLARVLHSNSQWLKYEVNMLKSADWVITVIDEMAERIRKLNIPPDKVVVVPNTIRISDFNFPDIHPDDRYITMLYIGGITYHRGLQVVIKGMKLILEKYKNARLWIAGTGNYVENLKKLAEGLNLGDSIQFLGWKNIPEMAELLMISDIGIIPHIKSEHTDHTIPNKIYQYAYANKPIITSNCRPLERLVEEMEVGVSYKHDSVKDFVESFLKLKESLLPNNIGRNGRRYIIEKYNWEKTVDPLLKMYKSIQEEELN